MTEQMIGFWLLNFFSKTGRWNFETPEKAKPTALLECGPGRGTLMRDILRVLLQFKVCKNIDISFVEASPFLQKEQQKTIKELFKTRDIW